MTAPVMAVREWPQSIATPPLGALKSASGVARAYARSALGTWHVNHLADDTETIVGELVSNAVNASTGNDGEPLYIDGRMPEIRLCLFTDGTVLRIEVWDQAGGIPAGTGGIGWEAEAGRGLSMVDALSAGWGWYPGPAGKCVWAEMLIGQPAGAYPARPVN
jgi:anti-sigma regulatory factor (Ser/Thr protein kinase)